MINKKLVFVLSAALATFGCGGRSVEPAGDAPSGTDPAVVVAVDTPQRIVFQSEQGAGMDVWVMNADGSDQRNPASTLALSLGR